MHKTAEQKLREIAEKMGWERSPYSKPPYSWGTVTQAQYEGPVYHIKMTMGLAELRKLAKVVGEVCA